MLRGLFEIERPNEKNGSRFDDDANRMRRTQLHRNVPEIWNRDETGARERIARLFSIDFAFIEEILHSATSGISFSDGNASAAIFDHYHATNSATGRSYYR